MTMQFNKVRGILSALALAGLVSPSAALAKDHAMGSGKTSQMSRGNLTARSLQNNSVKNFQPSIKNTARLQTNLGAGNVIKSGQIGNSGVLSKARNLNPALVGKHSGGISTSNGPMGNASNVGMLKKANLMSKAKSFDPTTGLGKSGNASSNIRQGNIFTTPGGGLDPVVVGKAGNSSSNSGGIKGDILKKAGGLDPVIIGSGVGKKKFPDTLPGGGLPPGGTGGGIGGGLGGGTGGGTGGGSGGGSPHDHHCNFPWPIFLPGNFGGYNCGPVYGGGTVFVDANPAVIQQTVAVEAPAPVIQASAIEAGNIDLVLEDIELLQGATRVAGPAYRVKFRNQGLQTAGRFRVALLAAIGGQLKEDAPRAGVEVAGLAAGQVGEVTIRLPRTAMRMVSASTSEPAAFSHLFVAVDLDNAVIEQDKTNNAAILERAELEGPAK